MVKNEVLSFFEANPFLLVSEERLASMICRPRDMVCQAVRELESAGLISRRFGEALLGIGEAAARTTPPEST